MKNQRKTQRNIGKQGESGEKQKNTRKHGQSGENIEKRLKTGRIREKHGKTEKHEKT